MFWKLEMCFPTGGKQNAAQGAWWLDESGDSS